MSTVAAAEPFSPDALLEKHDVSRRSRRQKGILAFLAQDADTRVFCHVNGQLRKDRQKDEILRFVEFWKKLAGPAFRMTDRMGEFPALWELRRAGRRTPSPLLSAVPWH